MFTKIYSLSRSLDKKFKLKVSLQVISAHRHAVMLGGLAARSTLWIHAFHEFCMLLGQEQMLWMLLIMVCGSELVWFPHSLLFIVCHHSLSSHSQMCLPCLFFFRACVFVCVFGFLDFQFSPFVWQQTGWRNVYKSWAQNGFESNNE